MKTKLRRFVPRLFTLDDRTLPAVTYSLEIFGPDLHILHVTGDAGANEITITDDGTASGITIVGDGGAPYTAPTLITHIMVDTLEGDDTVTYNLTAPLSVFRLVDAQLGKGNDLFTANISNQTIATGGELHINGAGDGGRDTMVLNAQSVTTNANTLLQVFFAGEAGKDTITLDYSAATQAGAVVLEKDQRH